MWALAPSNAEFRPAVEPVASGVCSSAQTRPPYGLRLESQWWLPFLDGTSNPAPQPISRLSQLSGRAAILPPENQ